MICLDKTVQELGHQPRLCDYVYAKCEKCQKETKIKLASYRKTVRRISKYSCSECAVVAREGVPLSEETRKKIGEVHKKRWAEGKCENVREILSKRNKDPNFIKNSKTARATFWLSEEGQELKEKYGSSDYKEMISVEVKKSWLRPETRALSVQASRRIHQNEDYRKLIGKKSRESWENPEYAQKVRAAVKRPEHRQGISERSKRYWLDPDFRDRMETVIRKRWEDPLWRAKWLAIVQSEESRTRSARLLASRPRNFMSKPHKVVAGLLDDLEVKYENEHVLGPYSYDIFIPSHNLFIEVNGDWVHNQEERKPKDRAKMTYLQNFPQYRMKTIWEHELLCLDMVRDRIKHWLGLKDVETIDFNFADVELRSIEADLADFFLSKYHYLRGVGRNGRALGCFLKDELIAVCCFASLTRQQTAENLGLPSRVVREMSRFCIHPDYHKKNFASWFIRRACGWLKKQNAKVKIKMLVAFADKTYGHSGAIYKAANWTLDRVVPPTYWYVKPDGYVMHKKTLWDHAKAIKMGERQFAETYGYYRVDGLERYRFTLPLI
jgi:GNAT superfamily N-acetyltransferase